MLAALGEAGITADLVVGTSVGSLNGAMLADAGDVGAAAEILDQVWRDLTTSSVFPGSRLTQGWRVVRGQSVFPDHGLRSLLREVLGPSPTFDRLVLPFAVVTSSVLTGHANAFTTGELAGPLLASSAIPGLLPIQELDGHPHWDGGVAANVLLLTALRMGAASLHAGVATRARRLTVACDAAHNRDLVPCTARMMCEKMQVLHEVRAAPAHEALPWRQTC